MDSAASSWRRLCSAGLLLPRFLFIIFPAPLLLADGEIEAAAAVLEAGFFYTCLSPKFLSIWDNKWDIKAWNPQTGGGGGGREKRRGFPVLYSVYYMTSH